MGSWKTSCSFELSMIFFLYLSQNIIRRYQDRKFVMRIIVLHHKACWVMTKGGPKGWIFLSHSQTINGLMNFHSCSPLNITFLYFKKVSDYAQMQHNLITHIYQIMTSNKVMYYSHSYLLMGWYWVCEIEFPQMSKNSGNQIWCVRMFLSFANDVYCSILSGSTLLVDRFSIKKLWKSKLFFYRWQFLLQSTVNIYKQFEPRTGTKNFDPDLDPKCLTLWSYSSLKINFIPPHPPPTKQTNKLQMTKKLIRFQRVNVYCRVQDGYSQCEGTSSRSVPVFCRESSRCTVRYYESWRK